MQNLPTDRELQALFRNIAYSIGNEIRYEYEKSGDYKKHGIKYKHLPKRSSKPFESPAKQSGNLHSKIDVDYNQSSKVLKVGSNVKYLKFLELGTKKMLPRNGLEIAYKKIDIENIIDKKLKSFFK
jgi:phage gpG-like protein